MARTKNTQSGKDAPEDARRIRAEAPVSRLAIRERRQSILARLGQLALSGKGLEPLFELAAAEAAAGMDHEFGEVLRLQPGGRRMLLVAGAGWKREWAGRKTVADGTRSPAGHALATGRPVLMEDARAEKRFGRTALLRSHGVVSGVSVRLGPRKTPWGALGTYARRRMNHSGEDVRFLRAVANILSGAIEQDRLIGSLRTSEARHRLMTDSLSVLLAYCDSNRIYRFCNAAYERWFGLKRKAIIGKPLRSVIGPQAWKRVEPQVRRVLQGQRQVFEENLTYKHGPPRRVKVEYIPDADPGGKVRGWYAMIEDVTDQAKAVRDQAHLAAIVEGSTDAILSKSLDGIITSWNRAAEAMYGYRAREALGRHVSMLAPKDRRHEGRELTERVRAGESVEGFETVRRRKNGKLIDVSLSLSPIREGGRIVGASTIARDIGERREREASLREAKNQLEHHAEYLEQAVAERTGLLKLLHDVTAHCHKATRFEEALKYALAEFCRFDGWCFGHAYRPDPNRPRELAVLEACYEESRGRFRAFSRMSRQRPIKHGQGLPGRVWKRKQPQYVPISRFRSELQRRSGLAKDLGIQTAAAFPVLLNGKVLAVLEFFSDRRLKLNPRVLETMNTLGGELALVAHRTQSENALRRSEARLRRLVDSNIAGVFIADSDGSIRDANSAFLRLLGFSNDDLENGRLNWTRQTSRESEPIHREMIAELQSRKSTKPRETRFVRKDGLRVPVLVGLVALDEENIKGRSMAFVVDLSHLRRIERQILEISDYEKQQLGQDLHDGLSQEISGIRFQMDSLARHLQQVSPTSADRASDLVQLLNHTEQTAHDLARGLHPIRKESFGLANALEDLALLMSRLYQRQCEFKMRKTVRVNNPQAALNLYRIGQEAVGNAMKHARPHQVRISLLHRKSSVILEVMDDGAGFVPSGTQRHGESLGLDIMRYRAQMIGAQLQVESKLGSGTTVRCEWTTS